jgi:hypothetical protein
LIEHGHELLQRLFDSGRNVEQIVSLVILLALLIVIPGIFAIGSSPNPPPRSTLLKLLEQID